jgi:glycosyltransferase involved in cell wall biosynthesis
MVLPALDAAGMEVMAASLSRALTGRGHEVGVTCLESGGVLADDLRADGYRVTLVPAPGFQANVRAPALEAWFRALQPDAVHVHSGVWLKAARAARRAGVRSVVHTLHGLLDYEPWYGPALKRWAARYTDRIVSVSEPLRDYLIHDVRVDQAKVSVILNGVNTRRFRPGPRSGAVRQPLELREGRLVIGTVARLDPVKNHLLLLEAFALVHATMPQASLVIVGDGPLREALLSRVRELGLDGDVHFFGIARDVAPIYRDFDEFVLSSRAEGTSMSVLEAMASGVSVVATAVGGTPDLLAHGDCGMLVPSEDVGALAAAMTETLQDADRRRRLAGAAREHVIRRYSEDAMLRAYEALYRVPASLPESSRDPVGASDRCVE